MTGSMAHGKSGFFVALILARERAETITENRTIIVVRQSFLPKKGLSSGSSQSQSYIKAERIQTSLRTYNREKN